MQSPKKYGRIAKYVLTLLVATIASVQVAAFGMADFRVYQDMKSDIAEIERRMPRQQDSAGVDPGSVHYAGLGRIVIDGEVVQERTPAVPRPAVQPDPEPVQAPETSQPPPQEPSNPQEPKEDVPQKEDPAKTQSTNQAASSTPTPPKSSGSSASSGSGQSGSSSSWNQSNGGKTDTSGNGQSSGGSQSSVNTPSNSDQADGHRIYITRTGEKYHYDNSCNGGTYFESTLEEALNLGLDPCKSLFIAILENTNSSSANRDSTWRHLPP